MNDRQIMDIDIVEALLNEIAEELPREFYRELNGGILLLPQVKTDPRSEGRVYILGEYVVNYQLGRYINIYYGSVEAMYSHLGEAQLKDQLREILYHEFTHHVESLSGERGLEIKDAAREADFIRRGIIKIDGKGQKNGF